MKDDLIERLRRAGDPDNGYDGYVIRKACREAADALAQCRADYDGVVATYCNLSTDHETLKAEITSLYEENERLREKLK